MSRRLRQPSRCPRCFMHLSVCICPIVPRMHTRTRVVVLMHSLEAKKSTNTGRIAALALRNSEIVVYGAQGEEKPVRPWPEDHQPVLLYPSDEPVPPERFVGLDRPLALIVPDGNWNQAKKARKRIEGLATLPCIALPEAPLQERRLRAETKQGGMSTIEAIARVLGVLEGAPVQEALERVYRVMVDRTLWTRGTLAPELVEGGLPEGAQRHDPESGALVKERVFTKTSA